MTPHHSRAPIAATEWRIGVVNMLICGIGMVLAWLGLAVILSIAIRQSVRESLDPAFSAVLMLIILAFFISWLRGLLNRGRVLLDCGPNPTRWLCVMLFVGFVSIAIQDVFDSTWTADWIVVPDFVIEILFAVFYLILAFGRLKITERGIWSGSGLIRWNDIASYRWVEDSTLLVPPEWRFSLRGAIRVPREQKGFVDDLLSQYCHVRPSL